MERRRIFTLGLRLSGVAAGLTIAPAAFGQNYSRPGIALPTTSTPTFESAITPLVVGGTLPASTLTLRATWGVGAGEAIIFQLGNNGANEVLRLTPAIAAGLQTSIVAVRGNLLVEGLGDPLTQATALIVRGVAAGIDFFNTNYARGDVHERFQIYNSDTTRALEFNYFTGGGTAVQTGWAMDPASGIFYVNAGSVYASHGLSATGMPGQAFIGFTTAGGFLSKSSGKLNLVNSTWTTGVGFDVSTDAVLRIRTRAQTGYATVDALGYAVSGVAGASKTAGPVTSITVVNGLVTAIS